MYISKKILENKSLQFLIGIGSILFISSICYFFIDLIGYHVVALLLLLVVSTLAMFFKILPVVGVAVLSALLWNFLFINPQFTFKISTPADALLFLMYFVIAVMNAVFTTKVRKAEAAANKRKEKERTIQLYDTLFSSLSHELKTPISTIIGSVDNLKESSHKLSKENINELYNEIGVAGERLNRQVKNLLNITRLESGSIKLQLNWHDVNDVIFAVIKENRLESKQHQIIFKPQEDMPIFEFDAVLVQQILHNIIHNAILYTPPGSKIKIEVFVIEQGCKFQISDNGPGFPKDSITEVFKKFYRLPNSMAGGTGLGLSIAQGFAQAHNGKIELQNQLDSGARFSVTIPSRMIDPKKYQNE